MMVNLSPKAVRFVVEALEAQISAYQSELEHEELDDDRAADLGNDLMFMESLVQDLRQAMEQPVAQVF
jgi:hypothetical protein